MSALFILEKTTWGQMKGTRETQEITLDKTKEAQALSTL